MMQTQKVISILGGASICGLGVIFSNSFKIKKKSNNYLDKNEESLLNVILISRHGVN